MTAWRFNGFNVVDAEGKAALHGRPESELIENLTLAAAAPDLLAALKAIMESASSGADNCWRMGPFADPSSEMGKGGAIEMARAAIAKAEKGKGITW